jgi:hypothetical protein
VDYQPQGMTNSMLWQYRNSPNSFAEIRKLYLSFPNSPLKYRVRHSVHLASSCFLAGNGLRSIKESPRKGLALLALPFGWVLSVYIRTRQPGK